MKKSFITVMLIFIITITLAYLGWSDIKDALKNISPAFIIGALTLQLITLFFISHRWYYLLKKVGHSLSFGKTFAINMAASYVESVTPSVKLGGEAAKVYLLRKYTGESYSNIAGIMLSIKYLSMIPFMLLALVSLIFAWMSYEIPSVVYLAFVLLSVFFLLTALIYHRAGVSGKKDNHYNKSVEIKSAASGDNTLINKTIKPVLDKTEKVLSFARRAVIHSREIINPGERFFLIGISTLIWALYPLKVYLITRMIGIEADIFTVTIITFTAYLAGLIPLLPGGLGLFEGSMVLMFTLNGFSAVEGLTVTLVSRLVTYWFPLLLAAASSSYLTLQKNEMGVY